MKRVNMKLVRRLLDERKQYREIAAAIVEAGGPELNKQQVGRLVRAAGWHGTGGFRPRGSKWGSMVNMGALRR